MDYSLRVEENKKIYENLGLNPYSNGLLSEIERWQEMEISELVLILILMDYSLRKHAE